MSNMRYRSYKNIRVLLKRSKNDKKVMVPSS